jgi:hypothetical protein
MFLTGKNIRKGLFLLSLAMMVFITSCAEMAQMLDTKPTAKIDVPPPQTPQLQTFQTSGEYLKAGKASFDAQRFDEAQAYLSEAVRLDQKNQAAHLLLGVTYVKLGKGAEARREFDKTVQLDSKTSDAVTPVAKPKRKAKKAVQPEVKTGDAETARSWLKRLDNPLTVGILPPKQEESCKIILGPLDDNAASESTIQNIHQTLNKDLTGLKNYYYSILSKTLSNSGFYSPIELFKEAPMDIKQDTIRETIAGKPSIAAIAKTTYNLNENPATMNLENHNVKILIKSNIDMHTTFERGLLGGIKNATLTTGYNIDLYSVKNKSLIKHIRDEITINNIPTNNIENITNQTTEKLFQKMALEIHNALL